MREDINSTDGLPSSSDLDTIAEERHIAEATKMLAGKKLSRRLRVGLASHQAQGNRNRKKMLSQRNRMQP